MDCSSCLFRLLVPGGPSHWPPLLAPGTTTLATAVHDAPFPPTPAGVPNLNAVPLLLPFQTSLGLALHLLAPPPEDVLMTTLGVDSKPAPLGLSPATLFPSVWNRAFQAVIAEADTAEDRARLRSTAAPAAGAWIQSLPNHLRTSFPNAAFLSAIRYRLGLADPAWVGLRCLCGEATLAASHVLRCGSGSPGPIVTHHALREAVFHIATVAGYQVTREPIGHLPLRPADTSGCRPDLAFLTVLPALGGCLT